MSLGLGNNLCLPISSEIALFFFYACNDAQLLRFLLGPWTAPVISSSSCFRNNLYKSVAPTSVKVVRAELSTKRFSESSQGESTMSQIVLKVKSLNSSILFFHVLLLQFSSSHFKSGNEEINLVKTDQEINKIVLV